MSDRAKDDLETQLAATRGFSLWLTPELAGSFIRDQEFLERVLGVLQIYETELSRQIEGHLATKDWHSVLKVTSIAALDLRNEPMTISEMIVRLLTDAHALFADSVSDIGKYLDQQSPFGLLDDFMHGTDGD